MTSLRAAAQQELEALDDACGDRCNAEYNPCWAREVAETLRAALAEPNRAQKMRDAGYTRRPTLREMAEPTTEDSSAVELVQEPVAWMYTGVKSDGSEHGPHLVWKPAYMDAMSASKGAKATPLYTAPTQAQTSPSWLHYCPASDILTIHGRAYSGAAFAAEALATALPQEQAR